jgi:hypothetical protein
MYFRQEKDPIMRFPLAIAALGLTLLLNGFTGTSTRAADSKAPLQGLQFSYPTAKRNVVKLTAPEREFMLNEMRYYLDMLWVASDALSYDGFNVVAKVARSRVAAMSASTLPKTLEASLPPEYLALSRAQHAAVDELADTAEKSRDGHETLRKLSVVLQRCNECHAIFQYQAR